MGNNNSSNNNNPAWDSDDEGGGSDYEHTYNYHTSVLSKKNPADGFESDYEEDDNDEPPLTRGRSLRSLPSRNEKRAGGRDASPASPSPSPSASASTSSSVSVTERGDGNAASAAAAVEEEKDGSEKENDPTHSVPLTGGGGGDADTHRTGQNDSSHTTRSGNTFTAGSGNKASGDQQRSTGNASPRSTEAGPSSTQAGDSSTQAEPISSQAGPSSTQAGLRSTQTGPNSTQAGATSTQAGPSSSQAGHSFNQAGTQMPRVGKSPARSGSDAKMAATSRRAGVSRNGSGLGGEGEGELAEEEEEEAYQTAGEGSEREERGERGSDDDGSISTITPPRTRPQSDSDYTVSEEDTQEEVEEESEAEEEEDEETHESDYDTERMSSPTSRSSRKRDSRGERAPAHSSNTNNRSPAAQLGSPEASLHSHQRGSSSRRLPRRAGMSDESYRLARKRPPSPKLPAPSSKRLRNSEGISFSSNRTRYGLFDTDSELEMTTMAAGGSNSSNNRGQQGRKRKAAPPSPPCPTTTAATASLSPQQKSSRSSRSLRQAARHAATQFVETSRKILRDARTAARILRESTSTSKRRSSTILDPEEGPSRGKRQSPLERGETRRSPRDREPPRRRSNRNRSRSRSQSPQPSPDSGRNSRGGRVTSKRRLEMSTSSMSLRDGRRLRQLRSSGAHDDDGDVDSDSSIEATEERSSLVRKDGGRLQKFTRSSTAAATTTTTTMAAEDSSTTAAQMRFSAVSVSSLPTTRPHPYVPACSVSLPALNFDSDIFNSTTTTSLPLPQSPPSSSTRSSSRVTRMNNSFPSTSSTAAAAAAVPNNNNPFQNVTLRPTSSRGLSQSADSSVSPNASSSWSLPNNRPSPFSSLLSNMRSPESPLHSLALTAGSVWARISSQANHLLAGVAGDGGEHVMQFTATSSSSSSSPFNHSMPGPGGDVGVVETPLSYPPRSTPHTPSLSLTGQFAQNGRFAFLLENVLQVTVVSSTLATAVTNAIVITTDSRLRHTTALSHSVALLAGPQFSQACAEYIRRHPRGLQVCEVMDTPAGGQLPAIISHVFHVIAPDMESSSSSSPSSPDQEHNHHRRLLLTTYLNCLKHASQKLGLSSVAFPLIGADSQSADQCIQVFLDSLLVYLAERPQCCPLHAVQLMVHNPALARFAAEVLEARLQALKASGMDSAMAAVFREYFNIPDFTRNNSASASSAAPPLTGERSPHGKPAVKRRRL